MQSNSTNQHTGMTLQKLDTMKGDNNPSDQPTIVSELPSVDGKGLTDSRDKDDEDISDTEYEYEVVSDDELEVFDEEEIVEEELVEYEEVEYQEEVLEEAGFITEHEDDSDSDNMSNCSSVGDYDANRPIVVNPPDLERSSSIGSVNTYDHERFASIEAAQEETRKRKEARERKEEEAREAREKAQVLERARRNSEARQGQEEAMKEQAEILRKIREERQQKAEEDAFKALGFNGFSDDESEEEKKPIVIRSRSKSGSRRSKSRTRSSSSKKSSSSRRSGLSKSRSRSGSRSKLGNDHGKRKKERPRKAVSLNEMELGVAIADDLGSCAMAELSALEAELNETINLFTKKNAPNPETNVKARPGLGPRMKSDSDLMSEKSSRRPRLGLRSRSKIHLLDGEDKDSKSGGKHKRHGSLSELSDIGTIVSAMKNSSNGNATWDKTPDTLKPKLTLSLAAVLSGEKEKPRRVPLEASGRTEAESTSVDRRMSGEKEKSSRREPLEASGRTEADSTSMNSEIQVPSKSRERLVRASSLSNIMSYSSFDDGVFDVEATPRTRKSMLTNLISKKSIYSSMEGEEGETLTSHTPRRSRMMQMSGIIRHSARDLRFNEEEEEELTLETPKARRRKMMQLGGRLRHSAGDLGSNDDDEDVAHETPKARRRKMMQLGGRLRHSARDLGSHDDEDVAHETPKTRRRKMMQLGGRLRHSARDLGLNDDEDVAHETPTSRRRKMMQLGGRLRHSARDLGSNDDDEDFTLTPGSRRRRMKEMGDRLRLSARNLGSKPLL